MTVITAKLCQIVAEILAGGKSPRITRHASIYRVPYRMNDPSIRQDQPNQTDCDEIVRKFVDDPGFSLRCNGQAAKIGLSDPPHNRPIHSAHALRVRTLLTDRFSELRQFAGAVNQGM